MREIKLPFGRRASDGVMVSIQSVDRGLACVCVCPECNRALVACKGELVRPYFRHHAEPSECSQARETALHQFAKQLIVQERRLALPYDLGEVRSVQAEVTLPFGVRPDVLIEYETGETLAVEIWVSHQVEADKVELYATHNQAALEIDLRSYRHVDEADWPHVILEAADRWWTYPPLAVRLERERWRQQKIEELRRKREEAMEALRQAEEARTFEERKLDALRAADDIRRQSVQIDAAIELGKRRLEEAEYRQKVVKRAEERARTHEMRAAMHARLLRAIAPPNLQALVTAFGTYADITPEAWADYDAAMDRYQRAVRSGERYFIPEKMAQVERQSDTA